MLPSAHALLDMEALTHNLALLRRRAPDSKIMAVIKANAYGHGAIPVALALTDADAFAVARVDEGVSLREAGIHQRIAVLQGFISTVELALHSRFDLEPVIHSALQVDILDAAALDKPVSVWLKLDSGMHRLGFGVKEFSAYRSRLSLCHSVRQPPFLITHLANADELEDNATQCQLDLFSDQVAGLPNERSIANSLYGASPFSNRTAAEDGLRPVMTLRTRLIAIKHLKAGDAVGYGGDWVCSRPTSMGVAAIGYGDGYPRHASPGTPVLVGGQRVPLIGRVSMDMITVDLTECCQAKVGDAVTLWGEGLPVEEIARHAQTIPYVLLCNVTPRVKRVVRG